jgi:membrane protein
MARLADYWRRFRELYQKEIWQPEYLEDRSWRGYLYTLLRIFSISITVFTETRAASRAAALSFSSLLGFGPLIAITMVVAGMVVKQDDPDLAVNTLNRIIKFIAPQVGEYETQSVAQDPENSFTVEDRSRAIAPSPKLSAKEDTDSESSSLSTTRADEKRGEVNPELVQLINGVVAGSRSSTAGALGALTLVLIVILLFKSIEDAFNEIWGVREGRAWLMRIIYYWTILTLGAVLFFASITLLGAGAFINVFIEKLPFGHELVDATRWMLPLVSVAFVISMLTLFYRYIPNTHVFWRAAFIGALIVALLLFLNNYLAFIYVRRVVLAKSLYGSLGILPILMFGLYIFWLYLLIGGQISYAVQNVHFRSSQNAWSTLSVRTRERLSLLVLITIGRRFQDCLAPATASELSGMMKVPTQILNESINLLIDMKLVTPIPSGEAEPSSDFQYQPSRPLQRITLSEFWDSFEQQGENLEGDNFDHLEPLLREYRSNMTEQAQTDFLRKPLDLLITEYPITQSRPPYAFNE